MARRPRVSFATRLLVAGLVLVAAVVVVVTGFLLVSRERETSSAARSNAEQRAQVLGQLLARETAVTGEGVVASLAAQPGLRTALTSADPAAAVAAALPAPATLTPAGHHLALLDAAGHLVFGGLARGQPQPDGSLASVRRALSSRTTTGSPSIELVGGSQGLLAVDVALAVPPGAGTPAGVVLDLAPLGDQLALFAPVVGSTDFTTVFVPAGDSRRLIRLAGPGRLGEASTPAELGEGLRSGPGTLTVLYDAPRSGGGSEPVAGSFVPVKDAQGAVTGYVGVEAPVALFTGDLRGDEVSVLLIAVFFLLGTAVLVLLFVDRFVRRPVARLERGVARIAGGDYSADVPVASSDELGRLAGAVNRMRAQIQANIAEIERSRARLDAAVERLGGVSRALTTTTAGLGALKDAVVRAAAAISGPGTAAVLLLREADELVPQASLGIEGSAGLDAWGVAGTLLAGHAVRVDRPPAGWQAGGLLAVPMFYQDRVVGAVAVISGAMSRPALGDEQTLAVLANNAAVALENTRLFERERETVRRLRELDALKSDFLATIQHELRTPLTAVIGMTDLMEMCWNAWSERQKLDAITDIQVATRNLHDVVETIIDFSLMERDRLGLDAVATPLRPEAEAAVVEVVARQPPGSPNPVVVNIPDDIVVFADPVRLRQVLHHLVGNAVKFSAAEGRVEVRAAAEADVVRIDVVDAGIGIPAEALPHVFERFYQVDNTATRAHGGTGMGLALVRRLVEAHGGRITVESTVGRGSCFTVRWPGSAQSAGGELVAPSPAPLAASSEAMAGPC